MTARRKPKKPEKLTTFKSNPELRPQPRPKTIVFRKDYADQYDLLYSDKDYEAECDLLEGVFRRYGDGNVRTILDLGCGTGNHSIPLAKRGYEVTGVDISSDMIHIASRKADNLLEMLSTRQTRETRETKRTGETGIIKPVFLQGDVRTLDLCETFDAVLMMFAVLSYQLTDEDILSSLQIVRRHLKPSGLFVFDVWYGPAVLAIRPNTRTKVIRTDSGEVIRTASARLDLGSHSCEVNYQLKELNGNQVINESNEDHCLRYFFPLELKHWIVQAHMNLLMLSAFPEIEKEADESSWNVLVVARALI